MPPSFSSHSYISCILQQQAKSCGHGNNQKERSGIWPAPRLDSWTALLNSEHLDTCQLRTRNFFEGNHSGLDMDDHLRYPLHHTGCLKDRCGNQQNHISLWPQDRDYSECVGGRRYRRSVDSDIHPLTWLNQQTRAPFQCPLQDR